MELREVVRKILDEKDWSQEDLGDYLKTSKQNVNGMANGRPVWELHWQIFLKMLPLCAELNLIGERELLGSRGHEPEPDPRPTPPRKVQIDKGEKRRHSGERRKGEKAQG